MNTSTNGLGQLFTNEGNVSAQAGTNQLYKTAELTSLAVSVTNSIMETIKTDVEKYQPAVVASQKSHDAMDKLINDTVTLTDMDLSFLASESADSLDKMLRSQQSKRSRSKSKTMTVDNYTSMMIGAVAENLLRIVMSKPKGANGSYSVDQSTMTDEELAELAGNPDKLTKAIRNVQSKKSIYKARATFDETSTKWQQLLIEEDKLKSLRGTNTSRTITVVDPKAEEVKSLLNAAGDVDKLKAQDAKGLLAKITAMLRSDVVYDAPTTGEDEQ